jgi:hypothetical protein
MPTWQPLRWSTAASGGRWMEASLAFPGSAGATSPRDTEPQGDSRRAPRGIWPLPGRFSRRGRRQIATGQENLGLASVMPYFFSNPLIPNPIRSTSWPNGVKENLVEACWTGPSPILTPFPGVCAGFG